MSQEKRIVLFMIIVFATLWLLPLTMEKPKPRHAQGGAISPRTGSEAPTTTGSAAAAKPSAAAAPEAGEKAEAGIKPSPAEEETAPAITEPGKLIPIHTQVFDIAFDTRGARPRRWDIIAPDLVEKAANGGGSKAIHIIPTHLENDPQRDLPLEVSFKERDASNFTELNRLEYDCQATTTAHGDIVLRCVSPPVHELRMVKTYTFHPNSFVVGLKIDLENLSESPLARRLIDSTLGFGLSWGPGIGQYSPESSRLSGVSYIACAAATAEKVVDATPTADKSREVDATARWVAMKNKSFMAAIISPAKQAEFAAAISLERSRNQLPKEMAKTQSPPYTLIAYTAPLEIPHGESRSVGYEVFVGPMKRMLLHDTGYGLNGILFYSSWDWFRWLCLSLMALLDFLFNWCHSYGVAIILLTVVVRLLVYPLAHHGMKLNAKTQMEMGKIKPEIEVINKKYADDFQAKNKAMMEVYKKHGINPMAPLRGCVPLLIQFPVFVALYRLLDVSVELRGASFLWIADLAQPDRLFALGFTIPLLGWTDFNLLPFLMAATTVATQLLSTTQINDPNQKMMLYMMPVMLLVMMYSFSSGLFVYWITSNIWQAVQQYVTTRLFAKGQAHPAAVGAAQSAVGKPAPAKPRECGTSIAIPVQTKPVASPDQRALASAFTPPVVEITVVCPGCGRSLSVPESWGGSVKQCRQCGASIAIPLQTKSAASPEKAPSFARSLAYYGLAWFAMAVSAGFLFGALALVDLVLPGPSSSRIMEGLVRRHPARTVLFPGTTCKIDVVPKGVASVRGLFAGTVAVEIYTTAGTLVDRRNEVFPKGWGSQIGMKGGLTSSPVGWKTPVTIPMYRGLEDQDLRCRIRWEILCPEYRQVGGAIAGHSGFVEVNHSGESEYKLYVAPLSEKPPSLSKFKSVVRFTVHVLSFLLLLLSCGFLGFAIGGGSPSNYQPRGGCCANVIAFSVFACAFAILLCSFMAGDADVLKDNPLPLLFEILGVLSLLGLAENIFARCTCRPQQ